MLFSVERGSLAYSCVATPSPAQMSLNSQGCITSEPVPGKLFSIPLEREREEKIFSNASQIANDKTPPITYREAKIHHRAQSSE